jgi:hypothetical protein
MLARIVVGIVAGLHAIACSSGSGSPPGGPPPPPPFPPPSAGTPSSAVAPPVASGIPEPIVVSFGILAALKSKDAARLSPMLHSSVAATVSTRPLDDANFWVQAAQRDRGSKARSDGTRWLVSFADLGPEELAVLVLARDGGPLRLLDVQRMAKSAFEAFGAPAS